MPDQIYVLAHQQCGHICGCVGDSGRALLEQQRVALAAAGHRQWQIRRGTDDDLAALLRQDTCDACRITTGGGTDD